MSDHAQQEPNAQQQQESSQSPLFKIGGREYDVEAAKTKIEHADKHVQTVESEAATLRQKVEQLEAQLANSSKLDQVLDTLQANQVASPTSTAENTTQAVDKEALMQELLGQLTPKIEETLTVRQKQEQAQNTMKEVSELAQAKYGSEFDKVLRDKGRELGYGDNEIVEFATSKPEAFKRLFGLDNVQAKPVSQGGIQTSVNTVAMGQQQASTQEVDIRNITRGRSSKDRVNALLQAREAYAKKLSTTN